MGEEICFDGYLRSLVSAYQQWWRLYTLTDATGRESQRVEREQTAPAFFDFGLMVQTVDKEKVESQKEKGEEKKEKKAKIERLPVLEGICKYAADHVLLVGRPGSGKSTALARLLLQEAENALEDKQAKIPVLVELRYLPSEANESSVCDRIVAFMHKHDPALDIDEVGIKQLLRQGRLLLLVDGVNELPSDRGRVMVNQFRELYQKTCPMIFTTRELSAGGDLGIAKRLEMQPLTEPQMQQFVMAYLPTQGERLLRQLSGRLREFGQTPLLLWMLCSLFQQSEQIPPNLGMVFRAFTVGYGDRIKQDVTLSKDSRAWWGRLLQYLAFKMTCGENLTELQVAISRRGAEQFLVEFLRGKVEFADDCAVRWLEDLLKHHLIQISNDRIEFRHQLIQEYYAAEWLLGLLPSLSDARLQHDYLNYLKWTEPLALMLELVVGEEQAVRVVRLALEVDLRLGARLAGAVKFGFQEKAVGLLIQEIDEWKIPQVSAVEILGETRSDVVIDLLIQFLKDENKFNVLAVYKKIIEILGEIGSDKAVCILIDILTNHWYGHACIDAAEALGKIGSEKAIPALIDAIKNKHFWIKNKSVEALGNIRSDAAVPVLSDILKDKSSSSSLLYVAAEALVNIGSEKAISALINTLDWESASYLDKVRSEKAIPALIGALKYYPSQFIKIKVVEVLVNINSERSINSLIDMLRDNDLLARKIVLEELRNRGNILSQKVVSALISVLTLKHFDPIKMSLDSLRNIRMPNIFYDIFRPVFYVFYIYYLKNEYKELIVLAAQALVNISDHGFIESLINTLKKDSNLYVRSKVVKILSKCRSEKRLSCIVGKKTVEILNKKNSMEQINTKEILIKKNTDELIHIIRYIDYEMSKKAGDMVFKVDIEKEIPENDLFHWIHSLQNYNQSLEMRNNAIEVLIEISDEKTIDILISNLNNQTYNVSEMPLGISKISLEVLAGIGSEKAIEPMVLALRNTYINFDAAKALQRIAEKDRNLPTLTQQLPHLLTLIPTESSQQALSVITAIQARCKYYNYDIAQTPLLEENNNDKVLSNPQGNIINVTEIKNDFSNANFGGANIANLGGTVNEQKIVQKTEVLKQSLAEATKEIEDLLKQLAKTNPSEATIADTIQQEIKRNPTFKARLVNALKTGGIEALKTIFNNPFVSIPVETIKGFLEAEE
jgi:HEAT repeat protein